MEAQNTANILLIIGAVCLLAALVGGGLKAATIEFPLLTSRATRFGVALVGLLLLGMGAWPQLHPASVTTATRPADATPEPKPTVGAATDAAKKPAQVPCTVTSSGTGNVNVCGSTVRDINNSNNGKPK